MYTQLKQKNVCLHGLYSLLSGQLRFFTSFKVLKCSRYTRANVMTGVEHTSPWRLKLHFTKSEGEKRPRMAK